MCNGLHPLKVYVECFYSFECVYLIELHVDIFSP